MGIRVEANPTPGAVPLHDTREGKLYREGLRFRDFRVLNPNPEAMSAVRNGYSLGAHGGARA